MSDQTATASPIQANAAGGDATRTPTPAPVYRYLLCDLLTDAKVADLPLQGVSFGRRISRPETLDATLPCPNGPTVALGKLCQAYAGRGIIYVFRNGVCWGGFILWSAVPAQDEKGLVTVPIGAASVESYPFHRIIRADTTYTQVDQGVIIGDLWRQLQADPRGNIGVETPDQPTGVLRDRTWLAGDVEFYGDAIQDLADVDGGPEFTIDVFVDNTGHRHKVLRVADRLGNPAPSVTFVRARYGSGGRVLSWSESSDATSGGTTFQARGATPNGNAGQDVQPLLSDVVESPLLDRGWPLLDVTVDHTNVKQADTLNAWAAAAAARGSGAQLVQTYTVSAVGTSWSPAQLGTPVRLMLNDLWHTPAQTLIVRPVAVKVTAAQRGQPEKVDLDFTQEDL